jgi:LysR family transcriptional regulator of gallate degradation
VRHERRACISLRHFRAFTAARACGQLTAAGLSVSRSPSSVSRSISILETTFGAPLLARSEACFRATAVGDLIAARCALIEAELRACVDLLARAHRAAVRPTAAALNMQLDTAHLRALIAVHDLRSVQGAAHALAVSQPAISYSVRLLESDLGIRLFSRVPNGMIPTPAGMTFTISARRVLSELSKMFDDVHSAEGVSTGFVCVGGLAYSRTALLPGAIKQALGDHPRIVVRTVEGPIETLLAGLHSGEVDAVICAYPDRAFLDGIDVEPIASDPMGLFVSPTHPLAGRRRLDLRDLLDYPFILPPTGSITRVLLEDFFLSGGAGRPEGRVETSSYSVVRNVLMGSEHIAFRSLREFHPRELNGGIVALDVAPGLPRRTICLLQRRGVRLTAAVRDFLDVVRAVAKSGDPVGVTAQAG